MANRTLFGQLQAACQELCPAGRIHNPVGFDLCLLVLRVKLHLMGFAAGRQSYIKIRDAWLKTKVWIFQVQPENLSFQFVPIELVSRDVRYVPYVGLAVILICVILASGRFPVKAEVVLQKVLA